LIDHGADLDLKESAGKTARDMAEELKGLIPFERGLSEAGYSSTGVKRYGRFSEVSHCVIYDHAHRQRNTDMIILALPTVVLGIIFQLYWLPIYTAIPLSLALAFLLQLVSLSLARLI